ncbi:MAG: hypothetical protein V4628_09960 [Pseudomonadota bacterium]
MKIQLIDSRPGFAQAIILKEWMRLGLSICLLGLPVILGYFSIQIAEARNAEFAKDSSPAALGDRFDFSGQSPALQNTPSRAELQSVRAPANKYSGNKLSGFAKQVFSEKSLSQSEYWSQPAHNEQDNTFAKIRNHATAIVTRYGDVLKKGHIVILASAIAYPPATTTGFTPHKNGRIIDPASYIHSTIR